MSGADQIPEISPTELKSRMDAGADMVLVDVRETFEKAIADLPEVGQLRIPVASFPEQFNKIPRDKPVVLYCRSGSRSGWATQFLMSQGWEDVANLEGGVLGWRDEVDPSLAAY